MDTGVLLARAAHILLITALHVINSLACNNQTMMAKMKMGTLKSPYTGSEPQNVECRWILQAENGKDALYLRVIFASPKMVNCKRTFVDVHVGSFTLGRWCDLDSDLIHCPSPTVQITAYNSMGVEFHFEVLYSTGTFKAPKKYINSSGSMNSQLVGGIIGGVVGGALILTLVVIILLNRPWTRNGTIHDSRQASPVSYTNNDQVVNIRQDDPPDYWTVVTNPPPPTSGLAIGSPSSETRGQASGLLDFGAAPS